MSGGKSEFPTIVLSVIATGFLLSSHVTPAQAGSYQDTYKGAAEPSFLGWYVEGRLGGPITDEHEGDMVSPNVAGANGTLETETDGGFGGAVAIGRYFKPRWRGEVEWAYASTDDIKIDYSKAPLNPLSPATLNASGDITTNTGLFNVFRSWNRTFFGRLRPYNGAGIGFTHIDIDNVAPAGSRFVVDDSDTVFTLAYHSGFDWEISQKAALTLRLTTAYTPGGDYSARDTTAGGGVMTFKGDDDFNTAISAGLRVKLQ